TAVVYHVTVGAGSSQYRIRIADHGPRCSLRGRPTTVFGVFASGRVVRLHPTRLYPSYVAQMTTGRPADLTRKRLGEVVFLAQERGCAEAGGRFRSLRLGIGEAWIPVRFGGGPEPSDKGIRAVCGQAMSGFYAAAPGPYGPG